MLRNRSLLHALSRNALTLRAFAVMVGLWLCALAADAQCDAYIKLNDKGAKHPRIESITFPGDADNRAMYNSIYGHGGVIENPWVAFRVYMDNRQSLDLYVKQTPQLELDVTGFYTTPEQMQKGYGCDVLWAGNSIGAGSFRGWRDSSPVLIDTVASRTQTVVGNNELIVADRDWIFNGKPIQMTQRYIMHPDRRDLDVEIKLEGYSPDDLFCTGIQKLETDHHGFVLLKGVAASWGSNVPDKNHPELIETVGLGIVVAPENIVEIVEDDLNYLVIVRPDKEGLIRYRVLACGLKEKDGFADAPAWLNHIQKLKF